MRKERVVLTVVFLLFVAVAKVYGQDESKVRRLYRTSQVAVATGWMLDSWTTAKAINSPLRVRYLYCEDGSQRCQYPVVVETGVDFKETGFVSWFGIREPASIIAASAAIDASVLVASHFLYKKGGIWRVVAIGSNFALATGHIYAGFSNLGDIKSSQANLVPIGAFSVSW